MDPSSSPWRSFETPDPSTETAPQPGPAGTARTATASTVPRGAVIAIVAATVLLVGGAAWLAGSGPGFSEVTVATADEEPTGGPGATQMLVIDVAGAVADPGVYRVPAGSRVGDAISIAGGYGPRVDARRVAIELNLAAPLTDGQHLVVPSRDDSSERGGGVDTPMSGVAATGLIDINRASSGELDALPGIGPVTAAKIIASREASPFSAVEDLRDRKLVGQKTFDGLADLVTVR